MDSTRHFYAGSPNAIVSLRPSSEGVTVAITWPCDDDKPGAACHLSFDSFKHLIADGVQIQTAALEANHPDQYALFTDQEGTNR
ncbi:hypothetical protein [Saccharopolyspora griseoalba]|uniref:Uncharacterized protein n=1 Tax=Saccharopolyspora griseoalba TaxID=1431848 RepID=A0ABW2LKU0_9PSEU